MVARLVEDVEGFIESAAAPLGATSSPSTRLLVRYAHTAYTCTYIVTQCHVAFLHAYNGMQLTYRVFLAQMNHSVCIHVSQKAVQCCYDLKLFNAVTVDSIYSNGTS